MQPVPTSSNGTFRRSHVQTIFWFRSRKSDAGSSVRRHCAKGE